jgi:menaquinone-specific isochorismate synthase
MPNPLPSPVGLRDLPRLAVARRSTTVSFAADPAHLFRTFEGRPRGFWGRGDRWVAWGGALQDVSVPAGDPLRFDRIREAAASISTPGDAEPPPRLFGGFSFLDDPGPNGSWEGFPAARFVLPEVLLEGRGNGALRLTVQGLSGDATLPAELAGRLREIERAAATDAPPEPGEPAVPPGEVAEERGEDAWTGAVEAVLAAVAEGRVEKAVLARTRDVSLPVSVSVPHLLRFLRHENRRAHVFVFEPEAGRVLFGAAPEVLAELRGGRFHATAVAGSAPRGRTVHEEQLLAGGLLASAKDRAEHRMTLEEMVGVLAPRMTALEVPDAPGVLTLARIQHLETPIDGAARPGEEIAGLVEALHPTPAVCGRPGARPSPSFGRRSPSSAGGTPGRWGGSTDRETATSSRRSGPGWGAGGSGASMPEPGSWRDRTPIPSGRRRRSSSSRRTGRSGLRWGRGRAEGRSLTRPGARFT